MSEHAKQQGMALAIVLAGLVILSMISIALLSRADRSTTLGNATVERARAAALVEGAVDTAILTLFAPEARRRLAASDGAYPIEIAGSRIITRIRDACGLWDVNQGDLAVFSNMLTRLGAPDPELISRSLAAARKIDAGLLSRQQVRALPGVGGDLYRRLEPEITVNCRSDRIDPEFASPALLASVPGLTAAQVTAIIEQRRGGAIDPGLLAAAADHLAPGPGQTYEIVASHGFGPGSGVFRRAEVTLTYNPAEPYRMVSWSGGE
jgi:type II secretory pathway component PulK